MDPRHEFLTALHYTTIFSGFANIYYNFARTVPGRPQWRWMDGPAHHIIATRAAKFDTPAGDCYGEDCRSCEKKVKGPKRYDRAE